VEEKSLRSRVNLATQVYELLKRRIITNQLSFGYKMAEYHLAMVRTANGRLTAAEVLGHREFVLTKLYRSA